MPTVGRIEVSGKRGNFAGMEAISLQPGPIARSVADLELGLRALLDVQSDCDDTRIAPVALGDPQRIDVATLRIGLVTDDRLFRPAPALRRAVEEAGMRWRLRVRRSRLSNSSTCPKRFGFISD